MYKFDSETLAVADLIEKKKPECVDALEKGFWQARGEGLGIRESYEKSMLQHHLHAHDGLNHGEILSFGEVNIDTDDAVRAHTEFALRESIALGETEAGDAHTLFMTWYDLFRSWGGDVFLSYLGAYRVLLEIYDERNDMDEADALAKFETFPVERHKEIVIKAFKDARAKGNTVRRSLEISKKTTLNALMNEALGGLINGTD